MAVKYIEELRRLPTKELIKKSEFLFDILFKQIKTKKNLYLALEAERELEFRRREECYFQFFQEIKKEAPRIFRLLKRKMKREPMYAYGKVLHLDEIYPFIKRNFEKEEITYKDYRTI